MQEQQKTFIEVKKKLREINLQYMLLYPAKLKVISQGKTHFFERPEEVWNWLEMWDQIPVKTMNSKDPFFSRRREEARKRYKGKARGGGHNNDNSIVVREDGTLDTTEVDPISILVPDMAPPAKSTGHHLEEEQLLSLETMSDTGEQPDTLPTELHG
mgnify:CR=1 FL=1